jgi:hypothetical protein
MLAVVVMAAMGLVWVYVSPVAVDNPAELQGAFDTSPQKIWLSMGKLRERVIASEEKLAAISPPVPQEHALASDIARLKSSVRQIEEDVETLHGVISASPEQAISVVRMTDRLSYVEQLATDRHDSLKERVAQQASQLATLQNGIGVTFISLIVGAFFNRLFARADKESTWRMPELAGRKDQDQGPSEVKKS